MTEHQKLAEEAIHTIFTDAQTNALLYGVGFVRISYVNGLMEFSCVSREEFRDTADELIWLDNNASRETKQ
jgi:hypothetical protein